MKQYYTVPTATVIAVLLFISLTMSNTIKKPYFIWLSIGLGALLLWVLVNTPYCTVVSNQPKPATTPQP